MKRKKKSKAESVAKPVKLGLKVRPDRNYNVALVGGGKLRYTGAGLLSKMHLLHGRIESVSEL